MQDLEVSGRIGYTKLPMRSLHIIYASTSGHTEYVVDVLKKYFDENAKDQLSVTCEIAEKSKAEDLTKSDMLLLASGSWNVGGREGLPNPHMGSFLVKDAKDTNLAGKECLVIGLGDDRYKETARVTEHLATFINSHGGHLFVPPLVIVNEPYEQEAVVHKWADKVLSKLSS